MATVLQVLRL